MATSPHTRWIMFILMVLTAIKQSRRPRCLCTLSLKFALAPALRSGGTGFLAAKFHQQGWQKQEVRNQCA